MDLGKKNTNQISGNRRSVLYVGHEKTGKTFNAFSWPRPYGIYLDDNQDTLARYTGIPYDAPASFAEYKAILAELRTRKLDVETIVVDSFSRLAQMLRAELQGPGKMDQQKWGALLDGLLFSTVDLMSLLQPKGDHQGYHVVGTAHLVRVTDSEGNLIQYAPHIQGQFRDWLPRMFNTVLGTDFKTTPVPKGPGNIEYRAEYIVYTTPPNNFWKLGGGFADLLPGQCSGTYESLSKAWTS